MKQAPSESHIEVQSLQALLARIESISDDQNHKLKFIKIEARALLESIAKLAEPGTTSDDVDLIIDQLENFFRRKDIKHLIKVPDFGEIHDELKESTKAFIDKYGYNSDTTKVLGKFAILVAALIGIEIIRPTVPGGDLVKRAVKFLMSHFNDRVIDTLTDGVESGAEDEVTKERSGKIWKALKRKLFTKKTLCEPSLANTKDILTIRNDIISDITWIKNTLPHNYKILDWWGNRELTLQKDEIMDEINKILGLFLISMSNFMSIMENMDQLIERMQSLEVKLRIIQIHIGDTIVDPISGKLTTRGGVSAKARYNGCIESINKSINYLKKTKTS